MPAMPVTGTGWALRSSAGAWAGASEGRPSPGGLGGAAQAGDDPLCPPQRGQALLALEPERAGLFVDDRLLRRAARRLAHVDRAGLGRALDAGGRVDEVAGDHALALRADGDGSLAGEHTGAGAQGGGAGPVAEWRGG